MQITPCEGHLNPVERDPIEDKDDFWNIPNLLRWPSSRCTLRTAVNSTGVNVPDRSERHRRESAVIDKVG